MMKDCSISDDLNVMVKTVHEIAEIWDEIVEHAPDKTHKALEGLVSYALKIRLVEKFGEIGMTPDELELLDEIIDWTQGALAELEEMTNEH